MGNSSSETKPPSGSFKALSALIDDGSGNKTKHTGTLTGGNMLTGGDLLVSVIAKDPYTGQVVRLDEVKVEPGAGTLVTGIPPDAIFELTCPSYELFSKRITTGMSAKLISKTNTVQNQSLPEQVKIKDSIDNFSSSGGSVCRQYNENMAQASKSLGLTHERDDLSILQGKDNGRSPGVVVAQNTGTVNFFSADGKQNMGFAPSNGLVIKASSVDTGAASQNMDTMQYGGLPQTQNPMNPMVPQGTIVTPQPFTVPNVIKILNLTASIMDMIDLVKACRAAVNAVRNGDSAGRTDAVNSAENSSFENQVTGSTS